MRQGGSRWGLLSLLVCDSFRAVRMGVVYDSSSGKEVISIGNFGVV